MKKIISLIIVFSFLSFNTQKEDKKITIVFTPEEVGIVYNALGKLPAEQVEALRAKIATEYQKQMDTVKHK